MTEEPFDQWCVVELMGHMRLGGKLTEEEHFGIKLGRLDIPNKEGGSSTQYFGANAIFRIIPTTEEIATAVGLFWE